MISIKQNNNKSFHCQSITHVNNEESRSVHFKDLFTTHNAIKTFFIPYLDFFESQDCIQHLATKNVILVTYVLF